MVEAALSIIIVLGLLGAVIDISYFLYARSELNNATIVAVRRVSAMPVDSTTTCAGIKANAESVARNELARTWPRNRFAFAAGVCGGATPSVQVVGRITIPCLLCSMVKWAGAATASNASPMEASVTCTMTCPPAIP
jgi:Flp pilus assembly protein TadG